jgi:ubiquinone biosynthesis protein
MAKLLTLLFEITGLFDMKTRLELVMLQKTMVVVEGVARTLDPRLDMWSTSEPIMREWIAENLGPAGKLQDAGEQVALLGRALALAPQMLARADAVAERLETATEHGFALSVASIAAIGEAEARRNRWSAVALWIIAGLLALAILR